MQCNYGLQAIGKEIIRSCRYSIYRFQRKRLILLSNGRSRSLSPAPLFLLQTQIPVPGEKKIASRSTEKMKVLPTALFYKTLLPVKTATLLYSTFFWPPSSFFSYCPFQYLKKQSKNEAFSANPFAFC